MRQRQSRKSFIERSPLRRPAALSVIAPFITALCIASPALAGPALGPILSSAGSFAVLGGAAVTNTATIPDPTTLTGNLGVSPGASITGLDTVIFIGGFAAHNNDALAIGAQSALAIARSGLDALPCTGAPDPFADLGGHSLSPGVYCFSSSAQLTGA